MAYALCLLGPHPPSSQRQGSRVHLRPRDTSGRSEDPPPPLCRVVKDFKKQQTFCKNIVLDFTHELCTMRFIF